MIVSNYNPAYVYNPGRNKARHDNQVQPTKVNYFNRWRWLNRKLMVGAGIYCTSCAEDAKHVWNSTRHYNAVLPVRAFGKHLVGIKDDIHVFSKIYIGEEEYDKALREFSQRK